MKQLWKLPSWHFLGRIWNPDKRAQSQSTCRHDAHQEGCYELQDRDELSEIEKKIIWSDKRDFDKLHRIKKLNIGRKFNIMLMWDHFSVE